MDPSSFLATLHPPCILPLLHPPSFLHPSCLLLPPSPPSPFLLILYVFILLVHTLSYSSSCTSSLTFISPLIHHLHPSPSLLPFPPYLSFLFPLLLLPLFPSSSLFSSFSFFF